MKKSAAILIFSFMLLSCDVLQAQWVQTNNPFGSSFVHVIVSGTHLFAGTNNLGVFRSTDNGNSWIKIGLDSSVVYALASIGNNVFAGTDEGVFSTTDNGTTWIKVNNGLPGNLYVYELAVYGNNLYAGTDNGVCISVNNGLSWNVLFNGSHVSSIAVNGSNIFVGQGDKIFRSIDNGQNWTQLNLIVNSPFIDAIMVNGTNVYAGTNGNGIYLSRNNGESWSQVSDNLYVQVFRVNGNNILAGTGSGVYLSLNSTNWTQAGLGSYLVISLSIKGDYLYAGTNYGVWKRLLSELTDVPEKETILPMQFSLSQNYPNPFNPSTKISYSIPKASNVKLVVYNSLGETVKTLHNGYKNAGSYSVSFNASEYPGGIYFYRLEAGNYSYIKKMVILK